MYGLGFQVNGTYGSIISILYGREKEKHTCMHMHMHAHIHTHIVVFLCHMCQLPETQQTKVPYYVPSCAMDGSVSAI